MSAELTLQIKTLPNSPGVYQYFDKNDVIIYVGKSKEFKETRCLLLYQEP